MRSAIPHLTFLLVMQLGSQLSPLHATSLTGSLKNPDGTGFTGTLLMSLSQQAALSTSGSCGGPASIVPVITKKIAVVSGALQSSPTVYGNDCLLPQGTYYNVILQDSNGNFLFSDRWVIQGSTIDVGTIISIVISGTTQTLGGVGVVQTVPSGNQTVVQPNGTLFSVNYMQASSTLQLPQGNTCNSSGCGAMTFTGPIDFAQGLINRTLTGVDLACSGLPDGTQAVRTDTRQLEVCITNVAYKVVLN